METLHKQGKKLRKYGRKRKKPAQIRYTNEKRWIKNKVKKILRHIKKYKDSKVLDKLNNDIKMRVEIEIKRMK